jgi:hypothetical protein
LEGPIGGDGSQRNVLRAPSLPQRSALQAEKQPADAALPANGVIEKQVFQTGVGLARLFHPRAVGTCFSVICFDQHGFLSGGGFVPLSAKNEPH